MIVVGLFSFVVLICVVYIVVCLSGFWYFAWCLGLVILFVIDLLA